MIAIDDQVAAEGVRLTEAGVEFAHEKMKELSNERVLEIGEALVRRCLVFRDAGGRRNPPLT